MTDLELTKACAEAMGYKPEGSIGDLLRVSHEFRNFVWRPLRDDAQAMALVKRFGFDIQCATAVGGNWWTCISFKKQAPHIEAEGLDLNRTICECAAKLKKTP